jgi:hypothetical protein
MRIRNLVCDYYTYHLSAVGWLEAIISVSLLSNAFRSSQATCSAKDCTLEQILRLRTILFLTVAQYNKNVYHKLILFEAA